LIVGGNSTERLAHVKEFVELVTKNGTGRSGTNGPDISLIQKLTVIKD
jgi:hypothetical protein